MTVDREQILRDAESLLQPGLPKSAYDDYKLRQAQIILALLAELEQAEANLDGAQRATGLMTERAERCTARLAKVPALVEAAKSILDERLLPPESDIELREAVAKWERE